MGLTMGWFTRSAGKENNSVAAPKPVNVGATCCSADAFLAQNGNHFRLSHKLLEKIYGRMLRRAEEICRLSGAPDAQIERFYECLRLLLNKRRGCTLPVNVSSEIIQRYREISTLTLVLMFTVKVTARLCVDKGVQVEQEGEIYTFSPYQNYIYDQFRKIGIVKNHNQTLNNGVIISLRHAILNDLLYKSPVTIQWFGMFNDMLSIIYRNLENKEEVNQLVFTQITDYFESHFWSKGEVVEEPESDSVTDIPLRSKPTETAPTAAALLKPKKVSEESVTAESEEQSKTQLTDTMPVATPQLSQLFQKAKSANGNAPSKSDESPVKPTATKSDILQCKNEEESKSQSAGFQSPLLQKLALKRNADAETAEATVEEELTEDHISAFMREILPNKNAYILANVISEDGELFDSKGLIMDAAIVYSSLIKLSELKKVVVAKQLVARNLTFVTGRRKAEISHDSKVVIVFRVDSIEKYDVDHVLSELDSVDVNFADISVK